MPCRVHRLRKEPLVIVAPRAGHAAARRKDTVAALLSARWILNPDGCGFRHALAMAFAAAGARLHVHFEVDAAPQEHLAMVAAGIGLSIVPSSTLALPSPLTTQVQQVAVDGLAFDLSVWSVWGLRAKLLAGTVDVVEEIFGTSPASRHLVGARARSA